MFICRSLFLKIKMCAKLLRLKLFKLITGILHYQSKQPFFSFEMEIFKPLLHNQTFVRNDYIFIYFYRCFAAYEQRSYIQLDVLWLKTWSRISFYKKENFTKGDTHYRISVLKPLLVGLINLYRSVSSVEYCVTYYMV